jgi:putative addiction module component (TIGR02574 family)
MRADELKKEINKLPIAEKLVLIEEVWDNIAASSSGIPLSEWQKQELDKRLTQYQAGKTETLPMNEVHDALRNKYK